MKYILEGNPVPLARPRFGRGNVYDKQRILRIDAKQQLEKQAPTMFLKKEALILNIEFYMPIPKKSARTNTLIMRPHTYRPDLSNLIKFVEDAASGILYDDDCAIAQINARKMYDRIPRTEFYIIPISKE